MAPVHYSGITELLLREKSTTGNVHVANFYIRRILRIWPLYFAALAIGFLLTGDLGLHYPLCYVDVASYFLFVGNWQTAAHGYLPLGMSVLWSITVEEQFYLAWPWAVRVMGRKGILKLSILLWLISQASVITLCLWHIPFVTGIWCNTFADLQYFALGSGLSAVLAGKTPARSGWSRVRLFAGGMILFVLAGVLLHLSFSPNLPYVLPGVLLTDIASAALFLSLLGVRLSPRVSPFVYSGKISYGLYVIHLWIWMLAGAALGIKPWSLHPGGLLQYLITIPILFSMAILSYNYFERPFLKLKSRFEFVKSREI
jgi:peptidoglycan/LPS O-acetylase OafA/YrhL